MVATADRVFVSNAHNDSITVIDAKTNSITGQIDIRIPGLEKLRGVLPIGMAYHEATGWLLVAEAGINAVGVIDTRQAKGTRTPAGRLVSQLRADRSRQRLRDHRERPGHRPQRVAIRVSSGDPGEAVHRAHSGAAAFASFALPDAAGSGRRDRRP